MSLQTVSAETTTERPPEVPLAGPAYDKRHSARRWLGSVEFWLVVAAFAVRIGFMLALQSYNFDQADEYSYLNESTSISRSIVGGHGYSSPFGADYTGPTSWIAPVYPYLCAAVFACFGVFTRTSAIVLLTLQSAFSALTCVPLVRIGERTVGRRAGIAAALLWAVFPWFGKWALTWVWEISLSALLFTWLFWYALRLAEPSTRRSWVGFGILWGFGALVNPALLTLLPASLVWCASELRRRGCEWFKPALLSLAVCLLVITPWLVRNRIVFGQFTFVRSNFGFEFGLGNSHGNFGRGWAGGHPTANPREMSLYREMGELSYVNWKFRQGLSFVRDYKQEFAILTAKRVKYFWDGSAMEYRQASAPYWLPWSYAVFSFLLLPALLVAYRRRVYGWQLYFAALLLYPLPYYFVFSQVRYRHALEPLMLLLTVYAAEEFVSYCRIRLATPQADRMG